MINAVKKVKNKRKVVLALFLRGCNLMQTGCIYKSIHLTRCKSTILLYFSKT